MNPAWKFPIIMVVSVVFGFPAIRAVMASSSALIDAGMTYLGALALAWAGVNGIFSLINRYADANQSIIDEARAEEVARLAAELADHEDSVIDAVDDDEDEQRDNLADQRDSEDAAAAA